MFMFYPFEKMSLNHLEQQPCKQHKHLYILPLISNTEHLGQNIKRLESNSNITFLAIMTPQESLHFKSNYQIKEVQFLSFPRTINPVSPSLKVPRHVECKPPKISPPWIGGQLQQLKNKCCVPLGTEIRKLTNTESSMEGPRSRKVRKHTYRSLAIFKG